MSKKNNFQKKKMTNLLLNYFSISVIILLVVQKSSKSRSDWKIPMLDFFATAVKFLKYPLVACRGAPDKNKWPGEVGPCGELDQEPLWRSQSIHFFSQLPQSVAMSQVSGESCLFLPHWLVSDYLFRETKSKKGIGTSYSDTQQTKPSANIELKSCV